MLKIKHYIIIKLSLPDVKWMETLFHYGGEERNTCKIIEKQQKFYSLPKRHKQIIVSFR